MAIETKISSQMVSLWHKKTSNGVYLGTSHSRCKRSAQRVRRDLKINYAPKLSKRIFSDGTPRESNKLTTDCAIIGGPHIR